MTVDDPTAASISLVSDVDLAPQIAAVAAATFPLACPPHSKPEDIAAHIARALSAERFAEWIGADDAAVLAARDGADGPLIGYALLFFGAPGDPVVADAVDATLDAGTAVTEISKMYVLPDHHGRHRSDRPSHRLMEAAVAVARGRGSKLVWLGVNQQNERAQRYYRKMGFTQIGTKTFDMNGAVEHDFILAQRL